MSNVLAIGVTETQTKLHLLTIPRRAVGPNDVDIKIEYCGMCHSDLHHCRQEWGETKKPSVPGHEIVGIVTQVGAKVSKFSVGQTVGVGCFVDSCRECKECSDDLIQYCAKGVTGTYGAPVKDGTGHTHGGYSQAIVVDENYVLSIPSNLDQAAAAPLLCAGITVWSPMKHYGVKAGSRIAVLGLGGLGHMAVKFASKMGAHVTVLSRSENKKPEALALGAEALLVTSDKEAFKRASRSFDFVIDTVSDDHDLASYLSLLGTDGTYILVGGSPKPFALPAFSLIPKRIKIGGSLVGGIKETQEMLDFCGANNIVSEIELVKAEYAEKAWDRMQKSDVKFRFVIDVGRSLNKDTHVQETL
ncbi:NADP-dependent alcohol dehydrogenase C [Chytriomyces cf. hyalinus JEL632]|nr:NADP-dependent alcohol dehydrogenase C [Chytriomyces cf. hyalinus JEL632]